MNIGLIGIGRMGSAIGGRLLEAGHLLAVFDLNAERAGKLSNAGASVARDIRALTLASDVVITMLPDDESLRAVAFDRGGLIESMARGRVHMVCGTHGVGLMANLKDSHSNAGQVLIACHVLGRPELAASGRLGLVPGGPKTVIESLRPILSAIGERVFMAGEDPLSATATKVAHNFMLGCAIEAIGEGMALVRKYGVDSRMFIRVLTEGLFNCIAYSTYGDLISTGNWPQVGASAVIGLKDAALALAAAQRVGVELPSLGAWRTHLEQAVARGEGELDWSVMAREQFRACGLE